LEKRFSFVVRDMRLTKVRLGCISSIYPKREVLEDVKEPGNPQLKKVLFARSVGEEGGGGGGGRGKGQFREETHIRN